MPTIRHNPCNCPDCQNCAPCEDHAPAATTNEAAPAPQGASVAPTGWDQPGYRPLGSTPPPAGWTQSEHGTYHNGYGHLIPCEMQSRTWEYLAEEHGPLGIRLHEWECIPSRFRHWYIPPAGGWTQEAALARANAAHRAACGTACECLHLVRQRIIDQWEPAWPDTWPNGPGVIENEIHNRYYAVDGASITYDRHQALIRELYDRFSAWDDTQPETCSHCGADSTRGANRPISDGGRVCEACAASEFTECSRCEALEHDDCVHCFDDRDEAFCESCWGEVSVSCCNCGATVDARTSPAHLAGESLQDGAICPNCVDNWAAECEQCGGYCDPHDNDNFADDGTDDDGQEYARCVCQSCQRSAARSTTPIDLDSNTCPIRSYSNKRSSLLTPVGKRKPGEPYYGVELETVCKGAQFSSEVWDAARAVLRSLGQDFATLKEDGSIGAAGFEIVSARATLAAHRERWAKICDSNRPRGLIAYDSPKCGLHVHVGRDRLTKLQVGRIVQFVNDAENAALVVSVAQRDANTYCRRYDKKLNRRRQPGSYRFDAGSATMPGDRYEAINLQNDHTIEFRIFKATLRYSSLMKSLEFVDSVVKFCRPAAGPSIGQLKTPVYLDWLRERKLDYPHLWTWLSEPSRGFVQPSKRVAKLAGAASQFVEV